MFSTNGLVDKLSFYEKKKKKKTPPNGDSWQMKHKISSIKFYTTISNESDKGILTMAAGLGWSNFRFRIH